MWYYIVKDQPNELYHHGIKGMKWGIRRYQNEDGTLTNAGKKRQEKYDKKAQKYYDKAERYQTKIESISVKNHSSRKVNKLEKKKKKALRDAELKKKGKLTNKEKAMIVGAAVVAAYATY